MLVRRCGDDDHVGGSTSGVVDTGELRRVADPDVADDGDGGRARHGHGRSRGNVDGSRVVNGASAVWQRTGCARGDGAEGVRLCATD